MKLVTASLFTALIGTLSTVAPAPTAASDFTGTWQNDDRNATGIVKVIIDANKHIRAFGACTPNLCDYGAVDFFSYGQDIHDESHRLGTGRWIFDFKEVLLTATLANGRTMKVEEFNRFTDTSGRQNYWMTGNFKKISASTNQ